MNNERHRVRTYEPWSGEQRPLYLAPMAGVSDLPYRLLAKECGADVTITEFTNSTALSREATASWRKMESDPGNSHLFHKFWR